MPKFKIEIDWHTSVVTMDGVRLQGVVGYRVEHEVAALPRVSIDFIADELTVEAGEAEVTTLSDDSRKFVTTAKLPQTGR